MEPDQLFFGRALARIELLALFVGGAGAIGASIYGGWRWGLAFILGAVASHWNFRWLKQLVSAMGESAPKPPRKRVAALVGLRYLLLAAAGYVILNFSPLSLAAALIGLLVPAVAVILEILFELIYART